MEEAELRDAIEAAPDDAGPRHVFADWLNDRGDARGELLQLDLSMPEPREAAVRRRAELVCTNPAWVPFVNPHFVRGFAEAIDFTGYFPPREGTLVLPRRVYVACELSVFAPLLACQTIEELDLEVQPLESCLHALIERTPPRLARVQLRNVRSFVTIALLRRRLPGVALEVHPVPELGSGPMHFEPLAVSPSLPDVTAEIDAARTTLVLPWSPPPRRWGRSFEGDGLEDVAILRSVEAAHAPRPIGNPVPPFRPR